MWDWIFVLGVAVAVSYLTTKLYWTTRAWRRKKEFLDKIKRYES